MRIYKNIGLIGLILLWLNEIALASTPNNVKITNVTQNQFTISWITDVDEIGYIMWGTDTNSLNERALDDRDKDNGTPTIKDDTHYVTATHNIKATTIYYYKIVSGTQIYDAIGTLTTGADISGSPGSSTFGYVYKWGPAPATGTIVYLNLESGSDTSALRSVLILSEGFWVESLGNFRISDLSNFFDYSNDDNLWIYAEGAKDGAESLTVKIANANPAATITLGVPIIKSAIYESSNPSGTLTINFSEYVIWNKDDVITNIEIDNDEGGNLPNATLTTTATISEGTPSTTLTILLGTQTIECINSFSNKADLELIMTGGTVWDLAGNKIGTITNKDNISVAYLVSSTKTITHNDPNLGSITIEIEHEDIGTKSVAISIKEKGELNISLQRKIDSANADPNIKKTIAAYEFKALDKKGEEFGTFTKPVRIEIPYLDNNNDKIEDNTGITVSDLKIYRLNETTSKWEEVGTQGVDSDKKIVWAEVEKFSVFTLGAPAEPDPYLPPKIPVYPNPFVPSKSGHNFITFGGIKEGDRLTKEVTIKIFTIAGELVHKIESSNCNGQIEWTPSSSLSSGIYIYLITNPARERVKGKLGIIK
ncbi:MAG: T9SS type A sorting domain-containing protein [bacterium]